ncbi:MAG: lysylphosphatidylglycerol synthase transmembrane domain-containing protein [Pirellulales bacterium]
MTTTPSATRRTVLTVAKLALAVTILIYLFAQARGGFARLMEQRVSWPLLMAGMLCTLAASTISFVRWHLLIRAVGIHVRLVDTLRLGALGLALNFVSPGMIGGDFFKAIFLAHGQPGRRTEAVATVVADRLIGLLTMLVVASVGILASDLMEAQSAALRVLCDVILVTALVTWALVALLLFVRRRSEPRLIRWAKTPPLIGGTVARLVGTVQAYRSQKRTLLAAFGLSTLVALFFISSFYLVARGLPIEEPPWREHLVIIPVAALVGAIPITPSGLGTLELAVEELYQAVPGGVAVKQGEGALVALARRLTEMAVALVGLVFYLTHRREVEEVYAEAEELAEDEERGASDEERD